VKIRPTVIEILTQKINDLQNFTFPKRANAKQRKTWQTSCPLQTVVALQDVRVDNAEQINV